MDQTLAIKVGVSGAAQAAQQLGTLQDSVEGVGKATGQYVDASGRLREASGRFAKGLGDTEAAAKDAAASLKALSAVQAAQMLGRMGQVAGVMVRGFVQAAASMETLQMQLTVVTGSSEEAARQLDVFRQIAEMPGLSLESVTSAAISFQRAGMSAKDAEESVRGYGSAIAATGGSAETMGRAVWQLTQILNKQKVTQEDLSVIAEAGLPVMQALQKLYGVTSGSLDELAKRGISATQVVKDLGTYFGQTFGGGAAAAAQTLNGQMEQLAESTQELKRSLGEALLPATKLYVGVVRELVEQLKQLPQGLQTTIAVGATAGAGFAKAAGAAAQFGADLAILKAAGFSVKGALAGVTGAVKALGAGFAALGGPLSLALAAVTAFATWALTEWKRVRDEQKRAKADLQELKDLQSEFAGVKGIAEPGAALVFPKGWESPVKKARRAAEAAARTKQETEAQVAAQQRLQQEQERTTQAALRSQDQQQQAMRQSSDQARTIRDQMRAEEERQRQAQADAWKAYYDQLNEAARQFEENRKKALAEETTRANLLVDLAREMGLSADVVRRAQQDAIRAQAISAAAQGDVNAGLAEQVALLRLFRETEEAAADQKKKDDDKKLQDARDYWSFQQERAGLFADWAKLTKQSTQAILEWEWRRVDAALALAVAQGDQNALLKAQLDLIRLAQEAQPELQAQRLGEQWLVQRGPEREREVGALAGRSRWLARRWRGELMARDVALAPFVGARILKEQVAERDRWFEQQIEQSFRQSRRGMSRYLP